MQIRFSAPFLFLIVGLSAACSDHPTDVDTPRLAIELRDEVLGLADTMSVHIRHQEHGQWQTPHDAELISRDQEVVRVEHTDNFGLRLRGIGLGETWVVAHGAGLTDSLRIEVQLLPIKVAGFVLDNGEYRRSDGPQFCFAHPDQKFVQIAGFVVNGQYEPLWRATEWSISDPDVLEVRVPEDQEHDLLIRPAAPGRTTFQMREGVYSGTMEIQVEEDGCVERATGG